MCRTTLPPRRHYLEGKMMKKTLLLTALVVSASAALAKDPSFADFKPLDVVDGYQTYGTPAQDISETFIFVDGGAREGKIASIHLLSVLQNSPAFVVVPGRTLAEYVRNTRSAGRKVYSVQCAEKTVREVARHTNVQGARIPFNRLQGVSKVAARVVCKVAEQS